MLSPNALVRYYGLPTERVANNPGSKTAPTWKAVKRPNGTTDYIEQPNENTYEKIQRAGEGYDLASAIARLEAGDRKSTRLNSSHRSLSRMPSSA